MGKRPETRIGARFAELKGQNRAGMVPFVTAGDPGYDISAEILAGLPSAGADLIEIGMPFTDPMADGPAIQLSSDRALKAGQTLPKTLDLVRGFRAKDDATPIVLMGYYNPIYRYGVDRFLTDAKQAGIDGMIVVDLPPEEENELCLPALEADLNFIYLTAPTTDDDRLPRVVSNASGFVYFVSITGITGTRSALASDVETHVGRLRKATDLPIAVGFGIRTAEGAADIAKVADACVVGSAVVETVRGTLDENGNGSAATASAVHDFVGNLADGVRGARQ